MSPFLSYFRKIIVLLRWYLYIFHYNLNYLMNILTLTEKLFKTMIQKGRGCGLGWKSRNLLKNPSVST